eukprot:TRINITY_DN2229_c0_g1_i1.p1 TRINITY_DN2229_c0_g1~~TRINITY_DN2229_c0_g1_i1.p1  ORF type:complete len:159 (+),score=47.73 TRINITY_DN2229_c0_g1_i1:82-558(+)
MNSLKKTVNKYEEDVKELSSEKVIQSKELNELKKEIELLKLDNANYIERISELKVKIETDSEQAAALKKENKVRVEKLEDQLKATQTELRESRGRIKQMETESRNSSELKVQMEGDIERAKEKVELLSKQLQMNEGMFEEMKLTKKSWLTRLVGKKEK